MNIFYRCKYTKKNIGDFKKNGNKKSGNHQGFRFKEQTMSNRRLEINGIL